MSAIALSASLVLSSTLNPTSGLFLAIDLRDHLRLTGDPSTGTRDKLSEERLAMKCRISTGLKILGELHGEHYNNSFIL